MARNYKRDGRGRFARVGSALGRTALKVSNRNKKQQNYRIAKATNKHLSGQAVAMGLLTKEQGEIARKRANMKAKMEVKGYKVANETTYRGDSKGRKRADGRYEYKVTNYKRTKK